MTSLRRKSTPTLTNALTRYLLEISIHKKSHYQERSLAKHWFNSHVSNREIGRITPSDLVRIRDEWLDTSKPSTVVRRFTILSHMYTVARKDWGLHTLNNPALLMRRPTIDDARDRRLFERITLRGVDCPKTELEWIFDCTQSQELPTIITLAVETAMRRSEICGITRDNVDLMHGVVHLPITKNGTSRDVPLTPIAKETLRKYLSGKTSRGRIFSMQSTAVTKAFIRAVRKARRQYEQLCKEHLRKPHKAYFNDLRFHDLRHEGTSRLATVFDMHELAKITGHKDTRMLLRYYHPRGWELSKKLARSALGKKQLEQIKMLSD